MKKKQKHASSPLIFDYRENLPGIFLINFIIL